MSYLYVFLQSCLLEIPIYLLFFRSDLKNLKGATLIFAVNSVTHPLVFFGFMNLPLSFLANILLAETFAWLSEAYFLQKALQGSWQKRLFASALANLVSWQMGPVLTYWLLG